MKTAEKIRTFICLDFPEEVVKEVARVQQLVAKKKFVGKLTELENLHLTLKFIGEVDSGRVERLKELLKKIEFSEFDAHLDCLGVFSRFGKPSIVWIKVGGFGVFSLQEKIDSLLEKEEKIKKEERFMSHLTIARIKYVSDKKDFVDYVRKISVRNIPFKVSSFELRSSELNPNGPSYKTLQKYLACEKAL